MNTPDALPSGTKTADTKTTSEIRPGIVFRLGRNLDQLPESLKLRNLEWGLLFAVTGEHTVAQIGDAFGLGAEERDAAFTRLLDAGLIEERELGYGEYLRAAASVDDRQPKTLARFLRGGVTLGAPRPAVPRPPAAAGTGDGTGADQTADEECFTRAVPTVRPEGISFRPLTTDPGPSRGGRQLSLKALMRFILDHAGDVNAGQLDVYRVFIRVNTRLLKRNGITTLRFEEDRLISDPELQAALTSSLRKTLGLSAPREVFV